MLWPIALASLLALAPPDDPGQVGGIAPVVGEDVAMVVHVDLARFDAEGLARQVAGKLADEAELAAVAGLVKGRVDALKAAGARDLFLLVGLADLPGLPPLAVPLPPGANGGKIAEVLRAALPGTPLAYPAAELIRGVVVAGSPATLARIKGAKPTPRPDLAAALASGGDSAVRVAIVPGRTLRRAVEESLPTLPPSLGGRPIEALTRGMAWASLTLGPDPKGTLRLVVRGAEAADSGPLGSLMTDALAGLAASIEADPAHAGLARALRQFRPEVGGDGVALTIPLEDAAALVSPPILQFREATRRTRCINNLKLIGLAMHNYHSAHGAFPAAYSAAEDGKPLLSWRVQILPFLDAGDLYNEFHLDEPWDSPRNKPLIARMPATYACPNTARALVLEGKTSYLTPRGPGTTFPGSRGVKIQEILDGSSNTILVVDVNDGAAVPWTRPDDWPVTAPLDTRGLFGHHGDRTVVEFADGSVRTLKSTVTLRLWQAFITRDGGEVLREEDQ